MKPRDEMLLGATAGVVLGGLAWLVMRKATEIGEVEPLRIGEPFPRVTGTTLAGTPLMLPDDLGGHVGVLILADQYDARFQVEAWADFVREHYGAHPGLRYLQLPFISGVGPIMRRVIDAAMVRGTPAPEQSHVMTIYGDLRAVRRRLGMTGQPQAYVIVLGRTGRVAWQVTGPASETAEMALAEALAAQGIETA